jgi:hypothetical protein
MRIAKSKWIPIVLAALTACAGVKTKPEDNLSGQWAGYIDRDGWERSLSINLENRDGVFAGSWMSRESQPGVMLDSVAVNGDTIRFQLSNLAFDGRLNGPELTGSVTDSASGASSGQFRLMRVEPQSIVTP